MYRTFALRLAVCIAFLAPLGLEARADPIRMTVTGNAGFGSVNFSDELADDILASGYASPPGTLGSRTVGPSPSGPIDSPISLTIGLTDTAASGSQGLTLSLSGSLTGQFVPGGSPGGVGGPQVIGNGTINAITINGLDPATNQPVSATIQGPNAMLDAVALERFASLGSIPQPLLAMLTTPSQYRITPYIGGGVNGIYHGSMTITPLPVPEPAPVVLLGLTTVAYLARRVRAARKGVSGISGL